MGKELSINGEKMIRVMEAIGNKNPFEKIRNRQYIRFENKECPK